MRLFDDSPSLLFRLSGTMSLKGEYSAEQFMSEYFHRLDPLLEEITWDMVEYFLWEDERWVDSLVEEGQLDDFMVSVKSREDEIEAFMKAINSKWEPVHETAIDYTAKLFGAKRVSYDQPGLEFK